MARSHGDAPVLSRRSLLLFGAGASLAVAAPSLALVATRRQNATPDSQATTGQLPTSGEPTGSFHFEPPGLRRIPVHYAIGAGDRRTATMVIVMHGDGRNAADYRDAWAGLIHDRPVVAVVPEFSQSDFPDSREYNQGGVLDSDGAVRPSARWTFSYVEPLFHEMRRRIAGRQTSFDLFGHSAGAQFVHRFVELSPSPLLRSAVAANAGWYTMPDPAVPFPYGAGGAPSDLFDWAAAFSARLTVLLGDQDLLDENLRRDAAADAQGLTRWERGHAFFERARDQAAALGVAFAWQLHEVAGVGHDYQQMSAAAVDLM